MRLILHMQKSIFSHDAAHYRIVIFEWVFFAIFHTIFFFKVKTLSREKLTSNFHNLLK